MKPDPLERWRLLINQLEIIPGDHGCNPLTTNEEHLLEFEDRAGFVLPQGYKEYCQVISSGIFGPHWFRIDKLDAPEVHLASTSNAKSTYEIYNGELPLEVKDLLDAGFRFGAGVEFYLLFFFDLRSYQEIDKSYDMYALCERDIVYIYNLGRDFYSFIYDICIGSRAEKDFPAMVFREEDLDEDTRESRKEDMENEPLYRPFTFCPCF